MGSVPTAERPPKGLSAYWLGVWRHALKTLKEQGTWAWEQRPLLDEYVYALMEAERARVGFGWLDALERYADEADDLPEIAWTTLGKIASTLPVQWDRHTKRAVLLAKELLLTPDQQAKIRRGQDDQPPADPLEALDAGHRPNDELARRRQLRKPKPKAKPAKKRGA